MSNLRLVSALLFECRSIGGLVALKIKFSLDFITNHVGEMGAFGLWKDRASVLAWAIGIFNRY